MQNDKYEFFGSKNQVDLQKRYLRLWPYLASHDRLSFVGRAIGLDDPCLEETEDIFGLVMELGFLALTFTRSTIVGELRTALEEHGLMVDMWNILMSSEDTTPKCNAVLAALHLPPGYRTERITAATPSNTLHEFQKVMQRCGVTPPPGYIMRGREIPSVTEMATDAKGQVVATGVGVLRHNPQGAYGKAAHVGFLATEADHRGKGLARILLAQVILACRQELGAELVYTGVREDNVPSQNVCRECGLGDSDLYFLGVANPEIMRQEQFTR